MSVERTSANDQLSPWHWVFLLQKLKKYKCRPLDGVSEVAPSEASEKPSRAFWCSPFNFLVNKAATKITRIYIFVPRKLRPEFFILLPLWIGFRNVSLTRHFESVIEVDNLFFVFRGSNKPSWIIGWLLPPLFKFRICLQVQIVNYLFRTWLPAAWKKIQPSVRLKMWRILDVNLA